MTTKSNLFKYMLLLSLLLPAAGCARQHTIETTGTALTFHYQDNRAEKIFLATSLDNYQYHSATKVKGNQWIVRIPLAQEFTYFYIIDGKVRLPDCSDTVLDDFGGKNCFYHHPM